MGWACGHGWREGLVCSRARVANRQGRACCAALCLSLRHRSRHPSPGLPVPPSLPLPARRFQICVDVFAFGSAYMDLPSLGALPKYTGGQLYYYPGFAAERDGPKLQAELR